MTTPILTTALTTSTKPKKPEPPSIYQSGFCAIGACENTHPLSPSGRPLRTCPVGGRFEMYGYAGRYIEEAVCTHSCHDMSREMEQLSGIKFPARDSHRESSPLSGMGLLHPPRNPSDPAGATGSGDVNPPTVAVASGRTFVATPSGRAARGQLEESVRHFVSLQVKAAGEEMIAILGLVPSFLAGLIDPDNPPSSGAVYSVLKRWETLALVELGQSPFRFIRFTERGKRELLK